MTPHEVQPQQHLEKTIPRTLFTASGTPDASGIEYTLPRDGAVSMGIYDGEVLLRTLFAGDRQKLGPHLVAWDGLDSGGNALPLGKYSWRLLLNDGLTSEYLALIGQTPIKADEPQKHLPGNHQGPSFGFVGKDGTYYQGARNSEGPPCMIAVSTADGCTKWNRDWQTAGPIDIVELGGSLFVLTNTITLQRINPANGANIEIAPGVSEFDLLWPGDRRNTKDDHISCYRVTLGADGDHLMVAYQEHDTIHWINPTNTVTTRSVSVHAPRYPRAGGPSGSICVLSGQSLVWVAADAAGTVTPIVGNLTSANALDYDAATGEFFVALGGIDQRVVRFSSSGAQLQTFGREGGRLYGKYDGHDFLDITYLQCDGSGGFYATETDHIRRVVHISCTREIVKELIGGAQFWMVVSTDPDDHNLAWYNNSKTDMTVVRINRADKTSNVVATYWMPETGFADGLFPALDTLPQWRFLRKHSQGVSQGFLVHSAPPAIVRVDEEKGILLPLALLGTKKNETREFPNQEINKAMSNHQLTYACKESDAYSWNDAEGNGSVSATGFRFHNSGAPLYGQGYGTGLDDDLNVYIGRLYNSNYADICLDSGNRWLLFDFGKSPFLKIPNCGTRLAPIWDWSQQELSPAEIPDHIVPLNTNAIAWTPKGVFMAMNSGHYPKLDDRHGLLWPDDSYRATSMLCVREDLNSVFPFSKQKSRGLAAGAMCRDPGSFLGYTNDCIVASNRNYYGAVAWTFDGLYAGFFLDHVKPVPPLRDWIYTPGGRNLDSILVGDDWNAAGTMIDEDETSVLWFPRGCGDSGAFRVTGWDYWFRDSGNITLTKAATVIKNGDGLVGNYYPNITFLDVPRTTRIDNQLWFTQQTGTDVASWSSGPVPSIPPTQAFSIRWTGHLIAPFSENFWFRLYNVWEPGAFILAQWWKPGLGYARLWLNNVMILDLSQNSIQFAQTSGTQGDDQPGTFESFPITLVAGESYSLKVEYIYPSAAIAEKTMNTEDSCKFVTPEFAMSWSSVTREWSRIPQSFLHTGTIDPKPTVSVRFYHNLIVWTVEFSIDTPLAYDLVVRYRRTGINFVSTIGFVVIPTNETRGLLDIWDPSSFDTVTLLPDVGYFGDGSPGSVVLNHIAIPDGLVAYYPLNEVDGFLAHDLIDGKHAIFETYMQPPQPVWNPGEGTFAGTLRFPEDGISLNLPFAEITGSFSLVFWFRNTRILPEDPSVHSYPLLGGVLEIWQQDSELYCNYNGYPMSTHPLNDQDQEWHQIAFTMEDDETTQRRQLTLYFDATSIPPLTIGGGTPWLSPFSIGLSNHVAEKFFVGEWDDIRVYNRVLAQTEIKLLKNLH